MEGQRLDRAAQKDLFLHRASDTIAFERNPAWYAGAFGTRKDLKFNDRALIMFGREFRPVLGRRSVSSGARQMLAVVALPAADTAAPNAAPTMLGVRTRSYWRRYDRKRQTSGVRLGLWPLPSGATTIRSDWYDIPVMRTSEIERSLVPRISKLSWTSAGAGVAVVRVEGENFFSGTEVTIGGTRYRGGGNLVLKSDRAMEIHTTVAALAAGDAVCSGRFGPSAPLLAPTTNVILAKGGINILSAVRGKIAGSQLSLVTLTLAAGDAGQNLRTADFPDLPGPILGIGGDILPPPYYFSDEMDGTVAVRAFSSTTAVGPNTVWFRTPFMGPDWASSAPFPEDAPCVTRMGGAATQTLILGSPVPFESVGPGEPHWIAMVHVRF